MAAHVEIRASTNAQEPLGEQYGLKTINYSSAGVEVSFAGDSYSNIAAGATTVVKSGAGVLGSIIVNNPGVTITVTVYDNTAASGTKIATILLATGMVLRYDCAFGTGLTVVTSGTCDITVTYK